MAIPQPIRGLRRGACLALFGLMISAAVVSSSTAAAPQVGLASVYSDALNGRSTASGERYDIRALTAAHRSLPLGAEVKVTRLDNGKSVQVRINDRGPNVGGRMIDLSRRAATALGLRSGVTKVRLEIKSVPRASPGGPSRP